MTVFPNQTIPALTIPTISGGTFNLHETITKNDAKATSNSDTANHNYTLFVFYCGIHHPICITQLKQIEAYYSDLLKANMTIVAISMDTKETAIAMKEEIISKSRAKLKLPSEYSLAMEKAKEWGL